MSKINAITNPNPLIAKKVNFFADSFNYFTKAIGQFEGLNIENHLSLVDKVIYHLETPDARPNQYLKRYFSHHYLQKDDRYVKLFKSNARLFDLIKDYLACPQKDKKLNNWHARNPDFLIEFKRFQKALKRRMVKIALSEIISFLRCVHDVNHHKDDLLYGTKILVSEFLLNGHSKRDLQTLFKRLMSRDIFEFPFPKDVESEQDRINFMSSRNFEQQFQGIHNVLKSKAKKYFFIYRIYGLKGEQNFSLKIGDVVFYDHRHPKLKRVAEAIKNSEVMPKFFSEENFIVAVTPVEYYSLDMGEFLALKKIKSELDYLNSKLKSNGHIERYSYVKTKDFASYSGEWGIQEKYTAIESFELSRLRENPTQFVKAVKKKAKEKLLANDFLFRNAISTGNVDDFWQYFDAIIPHKNGKDQIIDVISSVVLISSYARSSRILEREIRDCLGFFNAHPQILGMTSEEHLEFHKKLVKKRNILKDRTLNKLDHPFIQSLVTELRSEWQSTNYKNVFDSYQRILNDAQVQRNSIIHSGKGDTKSINTLRYSLPWLAGSFRAAIFQILKAGNYKSLEDAFSDSMEKAFLLINTKP
jgi:hypothetical protein